MFTTCLENSSNMTLYLKKIGKFHCFVTNISPYFTIKYLLLIVHTCTITSMVGGGGQFLYMPMGVVQSVFASFCKIHPLRATHNLNEHTLKTM